MGHLTVIVPTFDDPYVGKTVSSLLDNASGVVEVIVVLDGYEPPKRIGDYYFDEIPQSVKTISLSENVGLRAATNIGIAKASGEYIMKIDAHCAVCPNYDKVILDDCQEDWVMVPRRYSLDPETWEIDTKRPCVDYMFLGYPKHQDPKRTLSPANHMVARPDIIDDVMTFQGSCWVAHKEHFLKRIGLLDTRAETYGSFNQEYNEIGLKYWLGGGAIKVNKRIWYAHLSKRRHHYEAGLFSMKYKRNKNTMREFDWSAGHWLNDKEPNMLRPFSWLVEKFWPVPGWPDRNMV